MNDFSASRRLKTQESNYVSNENEVGAAGSSTLAGEYRPFSTIISNQNDEEVVRPTIYGNAPKNQPLSLELEHKRSVQMSSKSV